MAAMVATAHSGSSRTLRLLVVLLLLVALTSPAPAAAEEEGCPPADVSDRDDVAEAHRDSVDCVVAEDIASGYADGTFRPRVAVPRDQMASFIAGALRAAGVNLPAVRDHGFGDLDGNVHAANINRLAAAGVVAGFDDGTYRPSEVVRRDQMASFVLRALAYAEDRDVTELLRDDAPYADIAGSVHRASIAGAHEQGLLRGRSETRYAPDRATRRDQMASFLVRALAAFRAVDVDSSPTVTDHVIAGAEGTDIHVTSYQPARSSSDRPAPVMLHSHGWAGSRTSADDAFATELDRGFGVVSIDQRGHGDSGGEANVMDPELEGRDNIAVIDFVADLDWVARTPDDAGEPIADDPFLFAVGGSYGGGYQLLASLLETRETGATRLDALAPEITWFDLTESLAPQKVVRSTWVAALYGAGAVNVADYIHTAFAYGASTGQWPDETAPSGVENLEERFFRHGPSGFVADGVQLDIPALFRQGTTDNLFNLNEGWHNFEQTLTDVARASSSFIAYNGGHALPSVLPPGYPEGVELEADACSGEEGFAELRLRFFEAVLTGDDTRAVVGAPYRLTTADGACLTVDELDDYAPIALGSPLEAEITTTGAGAPQHAELAAGPLTVAGVPMLTAEVTSVGVEQRAFFALSVGSSPATAQVIQHNVMPIREPEPVTGEQRTIELPGVAVDVPEGENLYLTVSPVSDMFVGHGSTRTPGIMTFGEVVVDIPLVE